MTNLFANLLRLLAKDETSVNIIFYYNVLCAILF